MFRNIINKVTNIVNQEGFRGLLAKCLTFPAKRGFLGMRYEVRDCYEHTMEEKNAEDFLPRLADFTCHVVHTEQQADELEAEGYEFRSRQAAAGKALSSGAIAVCVFVKHELAHIGWIAVSEEARPYVDHWVEVDFTNKEACTGNTLTIPKYRGTGLMKYGYYKRFEILREMGILKSRSSVGIDNIASHRVHARFSHRIYAKVRYFRFLGYDFWRELPIDA
jgi:hypothetical protein